MGLDTTHDCWSGPYSAFKRFRDDVAAAALEHCGYVPNYEDHPLRAYQGWWDDDHPYTDILDVFFVHSDCDGYIFPHHAEPLADALEVLVGYMSDANDRVGYPTPRDRLRDFIFGLRKAADEWEIVRFH